MEIALFRNSIHGAPTILEDSDGYLYKLHHIGKRKSLWRCRNYRKFKCHARAATKDEYIIEWIGVHTHPPPKSIEELKVFPHFPM